MLTERDKKILTWIENYKAITVNQCSEIIFNHNYEGCRRRLKQLEDMEVLKSYTTKYKNEKVYYQEKKLKDHDLLVYDFVKTIKKHDNCYLLNMKTQPIYLKGLIRPDAFIAYEYNGTVYFVILEVDYTHYTSNIKMQLYEKLFKSGQLQKDCYGGFPIVIIARPTLNDLRYNSSNFNLIYTDLSYSNINNFLF
jgi:DNA-binding Lrp family transcriptional regulator